MSLASAADRTIIGVNPSRSCACERSHDFAVSVQFADAHGPSAPPRVHPTMSATLRDVAREAGVHTATAARALSDATRDKVSAATRQRVDQAARKLGYTANATAAALRTGRSGFVGMLIPDLANPLFAALVKSAEQRLRPQGWTLLLAQVDPTDGDRLAALRTLVSKRVDGLILATTQSADPILDLVHRQHIPAVLVNRGFGERRFPSVVNDDQQSMRLAIEYLQSLGHRDFLHLSGPRSSSTGLTRLEGFSRWAGSKQAVVEAGYFTREAGHVAMLDHLRKAGAGCRQTAVVAANDLIALGAIEAIRSMGGRVPEDFSVIGHNDMPFMDLVSPPLTTVKVHTGLMGQEAADLLVQRMTQPNEAVPATRLLHPDLVLRESCAAPRDTKLFRSPR
jgi:LacI family transcriptional regulator